MANEQNLKPFKKGQSGNPAGRPKGSASLPAFINKVLDGEITVEETGEKITRREQMVLAMIEKALEGDVKAFNAIFDRVEGTPPNYGGMRIFKREDKLRETGIVEL